MKWVWIIFQDMWILLITVTNLLLIPLYLPLESGCLCLRYFDDFTNLSHKQNFVSFYVLFIQSFISFKFLIKTRSQHVENAKTQSIKALLEGQSSKKLLVGKSFECILYIWVSISIHADIYVVNINYTWEPFNWLPKRLQINSKNKNLQDFTFGYIHHS